MDAFVLRPKVNYHEYANPKSLPLDYLYSRHPTTAGEAEEWRGRITHGTSVNESVVSHIAGSNTARRLGGAISVHIYLPTSAGARAKSRWAKS